MTPAAAGDTYMTLTAAGDTYVTSAAAAALDICDSDCSWRHLESETPR